jgi:hypothetical protein
MVKAHAAALNVKEKELADFKNSRKMTERGKQLKTAVSSAIKNKWKGAVGRVSAMRSFVKTDKNRSMGKRRDIMIDTVTPSAEQRLQLELAHPRA